MELKELPKNRIRPQMTQQYIYWKEHEKKLPLRYRGKKGFLNLIREAFDTQIERILANGNRQP